jgi:preprotein translocase subunit SecG
MLIVVSIILIVVCVILGFLVLIQNPKGGGLSGGIGGLGQQMMGVQQSTDTVEKGTWIFAGAMAILCLATVFFNAGKGTNTKFEKSRAEDAMKNANVQAPTPAPLPTNTATVPAGSVNSSTPPATTTAPPATTTAPPAGTMPPAAADAQTATSTKK